MKSYSIIAVTLDSNVSEALDNSIDIIDILRKHGYDTTVLNTIAAPEHDHE